MLGLSVALTLVALTTTAEAQQMRCDIHSIRATASGSEISQPLEAYRSHLQRPPLSAFTSFVLIESDTVNLSPGNSGPLSLSDGITGELRFDSAEGSQRIFNLSLRHGRRNLLNSRVAMTPGRPFFVVVGSVIPEGTLVLGIVCR